MREQQQDTVDPVRRAVSMSEVGAHAGVSQKTVSRVVNGEPHVRPEIRDRVISAISELGFRPNAAARALATNRSRRVGVVTIGTSLFGPASIITGVEEAARSAGYSLTINRTDGRAVADVQLAIDALISDGVAAVVVAEPIEASVGSIRVPAGVEILTFGGTSFTGRADEIIIEIDEYGGSRAATEYLLLLGHETVWHIAGPWDWSSSRRRAAGWQTALADAHAPEPQMILGDWSPVSGYDAMKTMLAAGDVTAVYAANDQMAAGAMSAVHEAGLSIPGDVSVVGFDDMAISPFLTPALSTVRQDLSESTSVGMNQLFRALEGQPLGSRHTTLPTRLIERASSQRPGTRR